MPSKSSNSVSADFLAAVTWGESSIHQSTYQAANEYLNFEPTPIPITTVDPINETNQTSDEPSVASTEAPHYYAWDLLPPPPPTTSLEPKEKKRSTKITKQANKVRLLGRFWMDYSIQHTFHPRIHLPFSLLTSLLPSHSQSPRR